VDEVKGNERTAFEAKGDIAFSKDKEARWLKKGKKYHFGYKAFVTVDEGDGYITSIHVTPANCSEVKEVENVLEKCGAITRLYADKGYTSEANEKLLNDRKVKSAIMKKAQKNKPLRFWEKAFNFLVSKKRYKVEQGFGTWKRRFRFSRASYFGLSKVESQCTIKAIAFNLLKGVNKALDMKVEVCHA
jgi:IS5 family transposase